VFLDVSFGAPHQEWNTARPYSHRCGRHAGDGPTITAITLTCGRVAGIDAAKFAETVDAAKKNCPVSKALAAMPERHRARDPQVARTEHESAKRVPGEAGRAFPPVFDATLRLQR
jgi:hypothetical protein